MYYSGINSIVGTDAETQKNAPVERFHQLCLPSAAQTRGLSLCFYSFANVLLIIHRLYVWQLFEDVSRENSQLQSQLQDTQRIISQTRMDLEKATQVTHNVLEITVCCIDLFYVLSLTLRSSCK